jgi:hypothetical protein
MRRIALLAGVAIASIAAGLAEFDSAFPASLDHPAIEYTVRPVNNSVAKLNRRILEGAVHLNFESSYGYLRSTLEALNIPIESQLAVFSKTSLQAERISPRTPRTIFFNDSVTVAWMRDGFIEIAAQDPQQGVIFYTLDQKLVYQPIFNRGKRKVLAVSPLRRKSRRSRHDGAKHVHRARRQTLAGIWRLHVRPSQPARRTLGRLVCYRQA